MQFSEAWLRSYANPQSLNSEQLAHALTMAGLEIESVAPAAPPFSGVVVAEVRKVERHPNADKLSICEVDDASGSPLSIVCGAPNVRVGIRVPLARIGAVLPGDFHIKAAKMRGVESHGMLCSARELGMGDDHSGLLVLDAQAPIGRDVREVLSLDDHLFTVKLTPNRGDCLSVVGMAREVAAISGARFAPPVWTPVPVSSAEVMPVQVHDADLCGRFSGRVIRGLNARASTPAWMRQRLERSGQRSISALVDISNYVMLELGRPSHVFDLDKANGGLEVRWGRPGESLKLLNGQTVEIDSDVGVIADANGVEALAGIMGGDATAVTLDTRNVFVEAAFWWPEAIQGRARRFNFSTDAGHRFERGTDYSTTAAHLEYLTRLVVDVCGTAETTVGPLLDQTTHLPSRDPVSMRVDRCRKVIGVSIPSEAMGECFARLGLDHRLDRREAEAGGDRWVVVPPPYRFDLQIEEDLIEEVARLWGFDRIPAEPPRVAAAMRTPLETTYSLHDVRRTCAQLGFQEIVTYAFVDSAWERDFGSSTPIAVINPIASDKAVMRTTLLGSMIDVLRHNLNRQVDRVRVFELGRVFLRDPEVADGPLTVGGVAQPVRLAALAYGTADDEQWGTVSRTVDYFDLKGDLERLLSGTDATFRSASHPALHPGRSACVSVAGADVGWIGELHPRLLRAYELPRAPLLFEIDASALVHRALPRVEPVARHPAVLRDVAMSFVESTPVQRVIDSVRRRSRSDARLSALKDFRLFDIYRPSLGDSSKVAEAPANALLFKGKSLAFRVVLQHTDRTLSDAEADAAVAAIVEGLGADWGAELRR